MHLLKWVIIGDYVLKENASKYWTNNNIFNHKISDSDNTITGIMHAGLRDDAHAVQGNNRHIDALYGIVGVTLCVIGYIGLI